MYEGKCFKLYAGIPTARSKYSNFSLQFVESKISQSLYIDKCPCAAGVERGYSIRQALFQVIVTQLIFVSNIFCQCT